MFFSLLLISISNSKLVYALSFNVKNTSPLEPAGRISSVHAADVLLLLTVLVDMCFNFSYHHSPLAWNMLCTRPRTIQWDGHHPNDFICVSLFRLFLRLRECERTARATSHNDDESVTFRSTVFQVMCTRASRSHRIVSSADVVLSQCLCLSVVCSRQAIRHNDTDQINRIELHAAFSVCMHFRACCLARVCFPTTRTEFRTNTTTKKEADAS